MAERSDVVLATLASATAMGQQEYERALAEHLPHAAPDLGVRTAAVRSLRSSLAGRGRLPLRVVQRLGLPIQHAAARLAYGPARLTHRCDLRLPPALLEVVTVHDLASVRFTDEGPMPTGVDRSLHRARAVLCPSHFAAAELRAVYGVEATVAHNGLDPRVWDDTTAQVEAAVPQRFVLHSGGATQRKNLAGLAAAWAQVSARHGDVELVLCGPPDDRRDAAFVGLPRVRMVGRVPRATHLALMSAATVVVVPSTYEGFGFPALEAMARGTAVVAAACASLPEICGDAALLCDPVGGALAAAIDNVLDHDELRSRLRAAGPPRAREFTWQRCAAEHAQVYRKALAQEPGRPGRGK